LTNIGKVDHKGPSNFVKDTDVLALIKMLHDVNVKGSVHVQIVKDKPRLGNHQQ